MEYKGNIRDFIERLSLYMNNNFNISVSSRKIIGSEDLVDITFHRNGSKYLYIIRSVRSDENFEDNVLKLAKDAIKGLK